MKERHKDLAAIIAKYMEAINQAIEESGLESECIFALAVGFLDMDSIYMEDNETKANLSLVSSISVTDETELDNFLDYIYYIHLQEDNPKFINYWIDRAGQNGIN